MLKDILENIKWYDKLYYQGSKVEFNHKDDYSDWLKFQVKNNLKRKIAIIPLIEENKLDKIINKAINDKKVVNNENDNLCITCLQSRIKILFNKKDLILVTVIHIEGDLKGCERVIVNANKNNKKTNKTIIHEKLDYIYTYQGCHKGYYIENSKNISWLTFVCDVCILLDL